MGQGRTLRAEEVFFQREIPACNARDSSRRGRGRSVGPTLSLSMGEIGRGRGREAIAQILNKLLQSSAFSSLAHNSQRMATEIETERAVKLSTLAAFPGGFAIQTFVGSGEVVMAGTEEGKTSEKPELLTIRLKVVKKGSKSCRILYIFRD